MTFEANIIADSITSDSSRIITLRLRYPRYIHAELMTHRVFSRNASSSRAIPVAKLAQNALDDMVEPILWGLNQPGMQSKNEELTGESLEKAKAIWRNMAEVCANGAKELAELGLHKQWANRPLEWFSHISVIVTSTEWENFFALRNHPDAQPEIRQLAVRMKEAISKSTPVERKCDSINQALSDANCWHLPYITQAERLAYKEYPLLLARLSSARSARVSYLTHEGNVPKILTDLDLFNKLSTSVPMHASPMEHQAYAGQSRFVKSNNLSGWHQFRKLIDLYESSEQALPDVEFINKLTKESNTDDTSN